MEWKYLMLGLAAFLILMPSVTSGFEEPIELSVEDEYAKTDLYDLATFWINATNRMDFRSDFIITISGLHSEWAVPGVFLISLDRNEETRIPVRFYPIGDDYGLFEYDIIFSPAQFPELNRSQKVKLDVIPPVIINKIDLQISEPQLIAGIEIDSRRRQSIGIILELKDSKGSIISTDSLYQEAEGIEQINASLSIPEIMPAGNYTLFVSIEGKNISASRTFEVEPVHDIVTTTERRVTLLGEEIVVNVYNNGNIAEKDYVVYQSSPPGFLTAFATNPESCTQDTKDGGTVCRYVIDEIKPGMSAQVSYSILYWPTLAQYGIGILIIAIMIAFTFISITKPKITKKYSKKGKGSYNIILEIRNNSLKSLDNVIMRDWVSPLANFVHEESAAIKPILRKSDAGTELIWKLGSIGPKEVRYITYKIKTAFIGSLKMPRAYARFVTSKGKRARVYSRHIVLK